MIRFLAPIILLLALSGALYKTIPVWEKAGYDLANKGWDTEVADDFVAMRTAVQKGSVDPRHGSEIMSRKWHGPQGGRMMSEEGAQQLVDQAVHVKKQTVVQRN